MALKRMLLEMGMGVDLHGRDCTKAARRAVEDAVRRCSLSFVRHLGGGKPPVIKVLVGVPDPAAVQADRVLEALPFGQRSLQAVPGGLEVPSETGDDPTVIATAAVIVELDVP
ncbi:MAG: Lin0512 family protein [Chloroflexi bacterium]|nr:Lin0512 family protein [Chloroflexota bacterium]